MIEKTARLYHKAVLKFNSPQGADDTDGGLFSAVLDVIYDLVTACAGEIADRRHYDRYGSFNSADGRHKLSIASLRLFEEEEYPFLWAMKYICLEEENTRRTWIIHIGIRQEGEDSLTLHFAQMYSDNLSGCLSFLRAPFRAAPAFLEMIMCNEFYECVTGGRLLPAGPEELKYETLDAFVEMLFDRERELPVILCGCPSLINPSGLYERVIGNALVYYVIDIGVIIDLNDILPYALRIEFDAIRIYMPIVDSASQRHPQFTAHDIQLHGPRAVASVIGQAYSESFRPAEWREFVTTDFIHTLRIDRELTLCKRQSEELETRVRELKSQITALEKQNKSTASKLERSKNTNRAANARELESLLGECLKELDSVKAAASDLALRLYRDMGKPFVAGIESDSPLAELEQAVAAYAHSVHGRRGGR